MSEMDVWVYLAETVLGMHDKQRCLPYHCLVFIFEHMFRLLEFRVRGRVNGIHVSGGTAPSGMHLLKFQREYNQLMH